MILLPLILACNDYNLIDHSIPPEEQAGFLSRLQSCLFSPSETSYPEISIDSGTTHITNADLAHFKEASLRKRDANREDFYEATGLDEITLASGKFSAQVLAFHRGCLGGSDNYAQNYYRLIPDRIDPETNQFETDLSDYTEGTSSFDTNFFKPYILCGADLIKEFGKTSPFVDTSVFVPGDDSDRYIGHWMALEFDGGEIDTVHMNSITSDWPKLGAPDDADVAYIEIDDPAIQSTRNDASAILHNLAESLRIDLDSEKCDQDGNLYHFGFSGLELE